MWFLVWLSFQNNHVEHYVLGQHATAQACEKAKQTAAVLITNSTTVVYCLDAIQEQKG